MNKWFRMWIVLSCLPFSVLAQRSVNPGSSTQSETPPVATANQPDPHITLDVVVGDKAGTRVRGLQQQDFTILANKQPQKIVSFREVDGTATGEPVAEVILLIDAVNTSFQTVAQGKSQISRFLQQNGGHLPQPVSMIFLSDDGAQVEKDATRDGNQLAAFLDKNETALRTIRRSAGFYGAVDRLQLSLRTLSQIAAYEAKRPGRKMLIWIGPGWPILSGPNVQLTQKDQQGIFQSIVAASTQLRQSRITLYAVDPLGTTDSGSFRTFYYRSFLKGVSQPKQAQAGNLALQVLAEQSGGRVMNSSNDVAGEIESCVADAEVFYVLSFDPPPGDGPNEYHALEIKLGKPGLTARTRAGYYSQP